MKVHAFYGYEPRTSEKTVYSSENLMFQKEGDKYVKYWLQPKIALHLKHDSPSTKHFDIHLSCEHLTPTLQDR